MTGVDVSAHDPALHKRILTNACLVLAGPDPKWIQDDPQGLQVLTELKALYDELPPQVQRDIKVSGSHAVALRCQLLTMSVAHSARMPSLRHAAYRSWSCPWPARMTMPPW